MIYQIQSILRNYNATKCFRKKISKNFFQIKFKLVKLGLRGLQKIIYGAITRRELIFSSVIFN